MASQSSITPFSSTPGKRINSKNLIQRDPSTKIKLNDIVRITYELDCYNKLKVKLMKSQAYNSQQLRNELSNLGTARQSLEKNYDVSGSMVKLSKTLTTIKPMLTKQAQYIKNFLSSNQAGDPASKQSQTRRYVARICDITVQQISQLLNAGEMYFTLDIRSSWQKLRTQFEKKLIAERQQVDGQNILEFLFKIINMKDELTRQFIKSMIYRKCVLWKDLNIINEGFVHAEKKKITKMIEDYAIGKGYVPTRPLFNGVEMIEGRWSLNKRQELQQPISQFLKIFDEELEQVFTIVRNYSNLTSQQRSHSDINRNIKQVSSLREEIENAHVAYQILQKKYRQAANKDEKLDIVEMKQRLKIAEETLQAKEVELKQLKYEFRDSASQMTALRQKITKLQDDLQKVTVMEMKKLKEVQMLQGSLQDQFSRLHKNISSFSSMFEFQSQGKQSLAKEIISLKGTIEKMAGMLGKQKNINQDLKIEIQRLNQVIIEMGSSRHKVKQ